MYRVPFLPRGMLPAILTIAAYISVSLVAGQQQPAPTSFLTTPRSGQQPQSPQPSTRSATASPRPGTAAPAPRSPLPVRPIAPASTPNAAANASPQGTLTAMSELDAHAGHDHSAAVASPGIPGLVSTKTPDAAAAPVDDDHDHAAHAHSHSGGGGHSHGGEAHAMSAEELAALTLQCRGYDTQTSADTPLDPRHYLSLFLLALLSAIGVGFSFATTFYSQKRALAATTAIYNDASSFYREKPYSSWRLPSWVARWSMHATFIGKHFGTGVILATAYIHMYPGATAAFADPCVVLTLGGEGTAYEGYPAVVLILAAFCMHAIEFWAGERARKRMAEKQRPQDIQIGLPMVVGEGGLNSRGREDSRAGMQWFDEHHFQEKGRSSSPDHHNAHDGHSHGDTAAMFAEDSSHAQRIATYLLESFVLLHSILIGLTLGLASPASAAYTPLLIALLFHQFFEGLALGARIGATCPSHKLLLGLFMCLLFTLATPVGCGIGMVARNAFPARSARVLLAQGVVDAAAAGVLMYAGWVHLLDGEVSKSAEFKSKSTAWKLVGFASVWGGAAVMAVIGKWA